MNILSKYCVTLLLCAAAGAPALAADSGAPPAGTSPAGDPHHRGNHAMTPEKMHAYMLKRQAALHDRLKLSASQEPAWTTFMAAITPATPNKSWGDHAAMEKLPAPERLEKHLAMSRERDARMASHLAALKTFYAVLTPEQQKIFDHQSRHHRHPGAHGWQHDHPKA